MKPSGWLRKDILVKSSWLLWLWLHPSSFRAPWGAGSLAAWTMSAGRCPLLWRFGVRGLQSLGAAAGRRKVIVQGVIDCLVKEPGGFLLIDFKTDRVSSASVADTARSYRMQIDQYRRAVEMIFGQPVKEAYLYFLQAALAVQMQ